MPYAAITYRVKPGHEDEIAAVFDGFQRVDTPTLPGEQAGESAGRLLGTGVFIKDDILVRVIHYDGDFAAVGRHMAEGRPPAGAGTRPLPRRGARHPQRGGLRRLLPRRHHALHRPADGGHPPCRALILVLPEGGTA
jgi:hypothetical protein